MPFGPAPKKTQWDTVFEAMLDEVAAETAFEVIHAPNGYIVRKASKSIGLTTFVDRAGKLNIIMSSKESPRPVSLGEYTMLELQGNKAKAKMAVKAKLLEL